VPFLGKMGLARAKPQADWNQVLKRAERSALSAAREVQPAHADDVPAEVLVSCGSSRYHIRLIHQATFRGGAGTRPAR
jgi:hypothetical protein